jgi:multidrug efflux pump subunit AcrA (membrane-fusion protein)
VLVVSGAVVARANASTSPIDNYRTAAVTTGPVEQRLNLTGSVERVSQVSQSFAVTGTVAGLSVSVGDTVTAGQVLATLDPVPLRNAVTSAKASLAKARATSESDQGTTTSATSGTARASGSTAGVAATPATTTRATGPSGRSSGTGANQSLAQAQQRVTRAEQAITADLQRASDALARCLPFFPSATPPQAPAPTTSSAPPAAATPTGSPSPASTPVPGSTTATTATTPAPSDAEIKACIGALSGAPNRQQIQRDQQALTDSQRALMTTVTLAITTAGNTASASVTTSPSTTTDQSSASRSSTSQSSTSQTAQLSGGQAGGTGQSSASRVLSDQAAVTKAETALEGAQADLSSATLRSAIAGTVGSASLVPGASSQGKTVVIVGTGAVEVTVNVPLASIAKTHVGQQANVTPQGATSVAAGAVTSISLLPTASAGSTGSGASQSAASSSSPTYPVVVLVPNALPALASGSRADVSLLIGTVARAVTVPNSALTPLSTGQAMVMTIKNGVATRAMVKTGYAGTLTTQITSGLTAGQQVVLADLRTALPTNTTSSRRLGVAGGAGGGFGSAGMGGTGLGGGTMTGGNGFPRRG